MIKELLYKWFNLEPMPCQSCETLKLQLSIANHEKQELLNTILSFTKPAVSEPAPAVDYEKVKPKMITWSVRKHMLEAEDRKAAQLLAEKARNKSIGEQIADLEKEVGIETQEDEVKGA